MMKEPTQLPAGIYTIYVTVAKSSWFFLGWSSAWQKDHCCYDQISWPLTIYTLKKRPAISVQVYICTLENGRNRTTWHLFQAEIMSDCRWRRKKFQGLAGCSVREQVVTAILYISIAVSGFLCAWRMHTTRQKHNMLQLTDQYAETAANWSKCRLGIVTG